MLKNYFKIALAVLKRRKFFTFISLFGISFTLAIVIVVASFMDHLLSAGYPDLKRNRELFINTVKLQSEKGDYRSTSSASFYFLDHYVSKLKTPDKMAISSQYTATNTYVNNKKLVLNLKYTNDQFWEVLDFDFIEGKPYHKEQIDNGDKLAVISEDTRNDYFGKGVPATGKFIETDNVQYRVIGVVKTVPKTRVFLYGDIYVPYSLSKVNLHNTELLGPYTAILLAGSSHDLEKMRNEYNQMTAKVPTNDKNMTQFYSFADGYTESFTRTMPFASGDDNGLGIFYTVTGLVFLFFLMLPTLNLVNINISRIMERSSEIGVRKAFGASSKTLAYQFLVENLILTFIGWLIGILLAGLIILVLNGQELVPNMILTINLNVLLVSLVACLIFGLLSGVLPAWRMSKMQVVTALKV